LIAQTFREACDVAESFGERLAAEGEICWGGMHSWREMVKLLEAVNRPKTLGFQADMAHTLLYTLGYNATPADRLLPEGYNWQDQSVLDAALWRLTGTLRPWTIDFHVAQNDATVHGTGTHDKTGRHCLVKAPGGKLNIAKHAGFWLRDTGGQITKAIRHICWDGCMFPNEVMMQPQTWNDILGAMILVRNAHGWSEGGNGEVKPAQKLTTIGRAGAKAKAKSAKGKKPATKTARASARKPAKRSSKKSVKAKVRRPARKVAVKKRATRKVRRK
jgi:hypothetical protein